MTIVKQENAGTNKIEMEIQVDAAEFETACNKVFIKQSKSIAIPGFRKGKAPRKMIEKIYGENIFFEEAINQTYQKALQDAIEETDLEVVDRPEVEMIDVSKEKGYNFKAVLTVKPEVEISDYKGIKAERIVKTPKDEEIETVLETKRKQAGRMVMIEDRAAQKGDTVTFDFEGFTDDEPFEGGKAENHSLVLGSGQFIPGFEEQIEGKNIDEEFDVNVTFPEEYHAENLKGKDAVFKCKLHEIKHDELPELDDEFAKDVSEFDTLDEFKNNIKEDLVKKYQDEADKEVDLQISKSLAELLKAEIPDAMIESVIDESLINFENMIRYQGMNLERYCEFIGKTMDELREEHRENADLQVKLNLSYEKIAELENIEVTTEEAEEEYTKIANDYKMELEEVKEKIKEKDVIASLKKNKAAKLIKDAAEIEEKAFEEAAKANVEEEPVLEETVEEKE